MIHSLWTAIVNRVSPSSGSIGSIIIDPMVANDDRHWRQWNIHLRQWRQLPHSPNNMTLLPEIETKFGSDLFFTYFDCLSNSNKTVIIMYLVSSLKHNLLYHIHLISRLHSILKSGKLADIFGRRIVMLYCYYGICTLSVVSIFAESYYVYLIARTLVGERLVQENMFN